MTGKANLNWSLSLIGNANHSLYFLFITITSVSADGWILHTKQMNESRQRDDTRAPQCRAIALRMWMEHQPQTTQGACER